MVTTPTSIVTSPQGATGHRTGPQDAAQRRGALYVYTESRRAPAGGQEGGSASLRELARGVDRSQARVDRTLHF
jgi:hypothetical protein